MSVWQHVLMPCVRTRACRNVHVWGLCVEHVSGEPTQQCGSASTPWRAAARPTLGVDAG